MRIIELDASGCKTPLDFLTALRRAIGAPEENGRNVDAIVDSMIRGGMNLVEPPYTIRIVGAAKIASEIKTEITALAQAVSGDVTAFRSWSLLK